MVKNSNIYIYMSEGVSWRGTGGRRQKERRQLLICIVMPPNPFHGIYMVASSFITSLSLSLLPCTPTLVFLSQEKCNLITERRVMIELEQQSLSLTLSSSKRDGLEQNIKCSLSLFSSLA